MKLYSENKDYKLYNGSMLDMLEVIEPNTIDSIVCDPPYELNFMGKGWDNSGIAFQPDTWKKCYEVLKPGGYLLAFGGSRTFHRIACAIEDAGFEIRDTIMWLYGSGFPKSMNIGLALDKKNGIEIKNNYTGANYKNNVYGKGMDGGVTIETQKAQNEWNGWGTALKPSFEPIIVARKPFKGSLVDNVIEYGVGGINIDECRVETNEDTRRKKGGWQSNGYVGGKYDSEKYNAFENREQQGRFPANTILTYDETDFDEVCGGFPNTKSNGGKQTTRNFTDYNGGSCNSYMNISNRKIDTGRIDIGYVAPCDSGSASRYFYCAKASKKDRDEGLDNFEEKLPACMTDFRPTLVTNPENWNNGEPIDYAMMRTKPRKNTHPTVKPTELMQYLIRLVSPNGATILDPFNGSGSTGKAVMYENKERNKNYKYIGIELTEEYLPIAKARIEYICNLIEEDKKKDKQMSIFDIGESNE